MLKVDKAIFDTNDVICSNISQLRFSDRGLLSQNILAQLRNFVEYIAIKIYSNGEDLDPNTYELNVKSLQNLQSRGDLRFLNQFHEMLQKSVSHYTLDKDGSERLMLKYYLYLLKLQQYLKKEFNLDTLENLTEFPLYSDTELSEYYSKIAERIEFPSVHSYQVNYSDRNYIQKVKPFIVDHQIFYEITFSAAFTNTSKFDRIIAFSKKEIVDIYAVNFSMHGDTINILNKEMPILIIDGFQVSIRPCEWENFSKIFGLRIKIKPTNSEYRKLMNYLTNEKTSLTELCSSDDNYYDTVKNRIIASSISGNIFAVLDKCRKIIVLNEPGANVLRYLLYNMNNRIIKNQYYSQQCSKLSNLYLNYGCIPFDCHPFCTSLIQHNPSIVDLYASLPVTNHDGELFDRYLVNNTEIEGHLFTSEKEIQGFDNIDDLITNYNFSLYYKHASRSIKKYKQYLYIESYVEDATIIINRLQELASSGVSQYTASVDSWMLRESYIIDDNSKEEALRTMFAYSRVVLIYGSAGTGKSTLIKHISNFWAKKDKIFLANTHPAVENLRRKVNAERSNFFTIAKFLSVSNTNVNCDILFIDECSTVSNNDMRQVLSKAHFQLLVLVGDEYQIESIYFGNWFSIAQKFMPKSSIVNLVNPYRTKDKKLLTLWNRVRTMDSSILEVLVKNGYVARLDESIFEYSKDDEIILCLNYDGLYGVNNINRFLQNANPNQEIVWGMNTYKIGDPILFNESNIFSPLIHNNSKGKIVDIRPEEERIWFAIELDEPINAIDALGYSFELKGESKSGKSIIAFSINKQRSTDEDDNDDNSTVVPFQVAYAITIHKAQGLEYNSVKIIITNEVEERITHSIFYTAITRAKRKLKIYWSPETEQSVLNQLKVKDYNKDAYLLSQLSSLKIAE